ncbi:MAG: carboxypeptidase-like regulatory domain-containing protein, partial [Terriglobia bacterium]
MENWRLSIGEDWSRPNKLNGEARSSRADEFQGVTLKWLCLALLMMAMATVPAYSQRITASLGGVVHDPSGAVIPRAVVNVTNTGTNNTVQAHTDSAGRFMVTSLPPGSYKVTIDAQGFRRLIRSGLILVVDQAAELDLTLQLGSPTQNVQVTGEQPLLNT